LLIDSCSVLVTKSMSFSWNAIAFCD